MRPSLLAIAIVVVAGCDISLSIHHFDEPKDASVIDAKDANAATIDALKSIVGCSDGTREGFLVANFPNLAACAGGWTVGGLDKQKVGGTCVNSGNDSINPGTDCAAADLCADGWSVCPDAVTVSVALAGSNCDLPISGEGFFATNQPASAGNCMLPGTDDLFGCGSAGLASQCLSLTKTSGNGCLDISNTGWVCPIGTDERTEVIKGNPGVGGVLCCKP